jgi:hypothetical protein
MALLGVENDRTLPGPMSLAAGGRRQMPFEGRAANSAGVAGSLPSPFTFFQRRLRAALAPAPYCLETVCRHVASRQVRATAVRAGHMVG